MEYWLEHGELSIVARRKKARYHDKYKRTDRIQENPSWMVTMCLAGASTTVCPPKLHCKREKLGKVVGRIALGFQMRDVPLSITSMMKGSARLWENRDQDDKKRKRIEKPTSNHKPRVATFNAAKAMGGGGRRRASWRSNSDEVGTEAPGRMDPEATTTMGGRRSLGGR